MSITIVGLGPGDPAELTLQARQALEAAHEIYLRTREHPAVAALPAHLQVHSFDRLYDTLGDFDAIYAAIANEIVACGQRGDVLYAVPGHPLVGETSVTRILAAARELEIPARVVAGVSFLDAACAALRLDPLARGLQIADATDLARRHFPDLDPDQPALIGQLYSRAVASDCKLTLLALYPADHPVTLVAGAGTAGQMIESAQLAQIDHAEHWTEEAKSRRNVTTLYVPPLARRGSFNALAETVAHLRAPEGCPWDREQTHQSLRKDFLEECYEVLETLDDGDMPHLREELGDLLLHVLMQTQIASEAGEFSFSEVAAEITEKLVRRHPHVFGDVRVDGTEQIVANWDKIKEIEHGGKKRSTAPRAFPALARAQKIAKRAKVKASAPEIAALVGRLPRSRDREHALGDVLFALAAYAADKHVDAESALRMTANRRER